MAAAVGFEFAVVAVAQQRVVVGIGFEINAAAAAAIAAGWPAARNVLFAAKRDAAVAAVAGFYIDFGFVNEHQESCSGKMQSAFVAFAFRGGQVQRKSYALRLPS